MVIRGLPSIRRCILPSTHRLTTIWNHQKWFKPRDYFSHSKVYKSSKVKSLKKWDCPYYHYKNCVRVSTVIVIQLIDDPKWTARFKRLDSYKILDAFEWHYIRMEWRPEDRWTWHFRFRLWITTFWILGLPRVVLWTFCLLDLVKLIENLFPISDRDGYRYGTTGHNQLFFRTGNYWTLHKAKFGPICFWYADPR